jgi:hypothetical protein
VGRRDTLLRFTHTQKCDQQQTASTLSSSPSVLLPFTSSSVTTINACKTHSYLRLQVCHHCRHMPSVISKSTDVITVITIFLPSPAYTIVIHFIKNELMHLFQNTLSHSYNDTATTENYTHNDTPSLHDAQPIK